MEILLALLGVGLLFSLVGGGSDGDEGDASSTEARDAEADLPKTDERTTTEMAYLGEAGPGKAEIASQDEVDTDADHLIASFPDVAAEPAGEPESTVPPASKALDILVLNNGDEARGEYGTGGEESRGALFVSGNWAGKAPPVIRDFDPLFDRLALHYDPDEVPEPEVGVETVDLGGARTFEIGLDGAVLMRVEAGTAEFSLRPDDVLLVAGTSSDGAERVG